MSPSRLDELHTKLNAATAAVSTEAFEPTTTASGVAHSHALFDTGPNDADSSALGRSCRKKQYTEKGLAYASDMERTKKSLARTLRTKERNAQDAQQPCSQPSTPAPSQTHHETQWETISFEQAALLSALALQVNYPIGDLSTQELIGLFEDICDSQASQRESQVKQTQVAKHVATPLGIGRGFHCDVNPPIVSNPLPVVEAAIIDITTSNTNTESESGDETDAKHHRSKRARITTIDNTDTESESELEAPTLVPAQPASNLVRPNAQPEAPGSPSNPPSLLDGAPAPNVTRTYGKSRTHVVSSPAPGPQCHQQLESSPSLGAWQSDPPNLSALPAPSNLSAHRTTVVPSSTPSIEPREPQSSDLVLSHPPSSAPGTRPRKRKTKRSKAKQVATTNIAPAATFSSGQSAPRFVTLPTRLDTPDAGCTVANARTDMIANAYERLMGLAASVIGQPDVSHRQQPAVTPSEARSSNPSGSRTARSKAPKVAMGDDEAERQAVLARTSGKRVSGRKPKPLTSDFDGYERQVLILAKLLLFAYSLAYGPYLTRETYLSWAPLIYERHTFPVAFQTPSSEVYEVMMNNLATLRGNVKGWLRPILEHELGLRKPTLSDADVQHNLRIFKALYPNHFHCKDPERRKGHYEANLLARSIGAALFNGPHAIGVMFRDFFDPMPLITVAYVLANIQFCLEEWSTGQFKPSDLKSGHMPDKYLMQMKNLKNFRLVAESRCFRLQQNWLKYGLIYSGASLVDAPEPADDLIDIHEFRPDTSDSDSDSESNSESVRDARDSSEPLPEVDENGRYTVQAKGKGRAID